MSASASLSSQLPTPNAQNGERGGSPPIDREGHTLNLQDQVLDFPANWPTPDATNRVRDEETLAKCAAFRKRNAGQNTVPLYLAEVAQNWPTPTANDWKGSGPTLERKDGQMRGDLLDYATEQLWSTPRASDGEKGGPNQSFGAGGTPLPAQAMQWRTPTVEEAKRGDSPDWTPDAKAGEHSLNRQAAKWSTAATHETGDYQYSRGDHSKPVPTLTGQAFFHQAHPIYTVGGIPSKTRRSLNPLFVEWLMGWPPGWTLLAWTDFACSATELSLWKLRMRFALSQLASPQAAPSAQLGLFG